MYKRDEYVELNRQGGVGAHVVHSWWFTPGFQLFFNPENRTTFAPDNDVLTLTNITWKDNEPQFNGTDSLIELNEAHNLIEPVGQRFSSSFSIRFRVDDLSVNRGIFGAAAGLHMTLVVNSSTNKLDIRRGGTTVFSSVQSITVGQTYDITLLNDPTQIIDSTNKQFLYIDGLLDEVSIDSGSFERTQLYHIGRGNGTNDPFDGMIDMPMFASPVLGGALARELSENPYGHFIYSEDKQTFGAQATLSNPTGTATGATTATGTVDTDTQEGQLFYYASTNISEDANTVVQNGTKQAVT